MWTLNLRVKMTILVLAIAIIIPNIAMSNGPDRKAKPELREKIKTIKKIKLLEVLELSGEEADKVLVKFTDYENKINDLTKKMDECTNELQEAVIEEKSKDIEKATDEFLKTQKELDDAINERISGMKKVLTPDQFAKYLVFERKFQEELRRRIMDKVRDRKENLRKRDGSGKTDRME